MLMAICLVCGGIWYILVHIILVKHINQGTRRMMRDMDEGSWPRIGQPRPWEPWERVEIKIMYWATIVMMLMMAVLYLQLAR